MYRPFCDTTEALEFVMRTFGDGKFFFICEGSVAYVTNTGQRSDLFL